MSQKAILLIGSDAITCNRPQAFEQVHLGDELRRVASVGEALNYLQAAQFGRDGSVVPGLVLVWSTVGKQAISKLISWMRSQELLAPIPIVVLTAVSEASNSDMEFEIASNSYLVRIGDTDTLLDLVSKHMPNCDSAVERRTREAFSA
ncbi:MAG TPA: hypothetical protein VF786_03640 [Terriglobales bacterium]